jgi:hypothetical protein
VQERGRGCVLCLGVGGGLVMYVVRVCVVWYLWPAVWRCLALCGAYLWGVCGVCLGVSAGGVCMVYVMGMWGMCGGRVCGVCGA